MERGDVWHEAIDTACFALHKPGKTWAGHVAVRLQRMTGSTRAIEPLSLREVWLSRPQGHNRADDRYGNSGQRNEPLHLVLTISALCSPNEYSGANGKKMPPTL